MLMKVPNTINELIKWEIKYADTYSTFQFETQKYISCINHENADMTFLYSHKIFVEAMFSWFYAFFPVTLCTWYAPTHENKFYSTKLKQFKLHNIYLAIWTWFVLNNTDTSM